MTGSGEDERRDASVGRTLARWLNLSAALALYLPFAALTAAGAEAVLGEDGAFFDLWLLASFALAGVAAWQIIAARLNPQRVWLRALVWWLLAFVAPAALLVVASRAAARPFAAVWSAVARATASFLTFARAVLVQGGPAVGGDNHRPRDAGSRLALWLNLVAAGATVLLVVVIALGAVLDLLGEEGALIDLWIFSTLALVCVALWQLASARRQLSLVWKLALLWSALALVAPLALVVALLALVVIGREAVRRFGADRIAREGVRAVLVVVAYFGLLAVWATGAWQLQSGWFDLLGILAIHLALGFFVRRRWAIALPFLPALALFPISMEVYERYRDEPGHGGATDILLAAFVLSFFVAPLLSGLVYVGVSIGRWADRRGRADAVPTMPLPPSPPSS